MLFFVRNKFLGRYFGLFCTRLVPFYGQSASLSRLEVLEALEKVENGQKYVIFEVF